MQIHSRRKNGKKYCNKELLDKCERGNKIALLWHKCWAKSGKIAKRALFYCPLTLILATPLNCTIFKMFSPLCTASLSEMRHNCLPFFFSTPPRFSHFPIHAVIVSNKQRVWTQKRRFLEAFNEHSKWAE